jgi:cytoskeleton protein RodZ
VTPLVAGVAVLGFAIYFVFIAPRSAASRDETVQLPPPTRDVAPAATPPQPSAVAPAVAVQPPEAGETLRFNLTAEGPCWVSATADGKPALARLLEAGTQEALEAKDQLVLRVGDPGALKLSINGAPARPLGGAGQPVTVQITRDNFREFLAQPQ